MTIRLTGEYDIVIRKSSLATASLVTADVCRLLEADGPLSEDDELLVFGPSFGREAAVEFIRRLRAAGLADVDDCFSFEVDTPMWCEPLLASS